ncbi:hypothetical protein [Streptomyces sp. NPDC055287]
MGPTDLVRAGLFIGVDRTGGLQKLNAAASGARQMHAWALAQGMRDVSQAKLITDAGGRRVGPDELFDAVAELLNGPGLDQLIVYFAGHGVTSNHGERWLLSDAPQRSSAAVNVAGSVELARYSGVGHVVFISDACRVAPDGVQAQNVHGVEIFPNESAVDRMRPVDQFFACVRGRTAVEIRDPNKAASDYRAIYTEALVEAASGLRPELLAPSTDTSDAARYLLPLRLKEHLEAEIPARLRALKLHHLVDQLPDAHIVAHSPPPWLSRIHPLPQPLLRTGPSTPPVDPLNIYTVTADLLRAPDERALGREIWKARVIGVPEAEQLVDGVESIASPFGPDDFETRCGVKVRGARITGFFAPHADGRLLGPALNVLRLRPHGREGSSALVRFEADGAPVGAVVAVLPGFIAALTFQGGELVDVAYEPSARTFRGELYREHAARLRGLRAVASAAFRHGWLRIGPADAAELDRRMRYGEYIDPSLVTYAAYAHYEQQNVPGIQDMAGQLRSQLGADLFDTTLLGRQLTGRTIDRDSRVLPFVPLMGRGWALLGANRVRLHPALDGLERRVHDSSWSLFGPDGIDRLEQALRSGEVR